MIRRSIEDDDENPDRWLVSYADFITLLFAFFVVMYSVSSVNEGKYKEFSSSMNTAFTSKSVSEESNALVTDYTPDIAESEPLRKPPLPSSAPTEAIQSEVETMTRLGQDIAMHLALQIQRGNARIIQNNHGLRIDIKDSILFTPGSADLVVPAKAILNGISVLLATSHLPILVEGHTDNTPIYISNAAFFSSWELSAVRASSVVGQFTDTGIENIRISALGYGPSQPISSNTTKAGQASNRHISILVLYESLSVDSSEGMEIKPH